MSSSISFQGLVTNLPTDQLISAIINQESQPMVAMQKQVTTNNTKSLALQTLSADLVSLNVAMDSLTNGGFQANTVSSSDSTNAYVSATASGATSGVYDVAVKSLATTARIVVPTALASNAAVGTGTYNLTDMAGKTVAIKIDASNNTLAGLAAAINDYKDPVTGNSVLNVNATVIQTGADGSSQLVLSANNTGVGTNGASTFSLTMAAGSALATDTPTLQVPTALASSTAAVGTGSYTVTDLAGTTATISITSSDNTLAGLAAAINSAKDGSGNALDVTASVVQTANGAYKLSLAANSPGAGPGGATQFSLTTAAGSALGDGVTTQSTTASQGAFTSSAATNADFILNGVELHRTSNTVGDAVTGVTFTLNKAQTDLTQTTNLTVGLDSSAAATAMQAVVTAYNQFHKDYSSNAKFTQNADGSYTAGVFNMDMTIQNMVTQVSNTLMNAAPGLSSTALYTTPAAVGLKTNEDGTLSLDSGAFQSAFAAHSQDVINLFAPSGTSSDPLLSYLTSSDKTTTSPIKVSNVTQTGGTYSAQFATTAADGTAYTTTLTSSDGTFYGAAGTPLDGLVLNALTGANGTIQASGGIGSRLYSLDTLLSGLSPGDLGGMMSDLSTQNANLALRIAQQQNYLNNSKANLETTYSNLETAVSNLQSASTSLSTLA